MSKLDRGLGLARIAAVSLALAGLASSQGGKKAPPKDDPEVPGLIKALRPIVQGKPDRDPEGLRILDKLSNLHPKLNKKQQHAVAKAVAGVFKARRKPDEVTLYLAAAEALSRFDGDGAGALARATGDRRWRNKKEWSAFRAQVIRLLGRPAEKKYVKLLLDLALKDNDDQARAKAGEALGDYAKLGQKDRKHIVGKLVKQLEEVWAASKANIDPNDLTVEVWKRRFAAIQDPWLKTLHKHTGQSFRDVQGWVRWWNKHKGKNWDKSGFRGVASK